MVGPYISQIGLLFDDRRAVLEISFHYDMGKILEEKGLWHSLFVNVHRPSQSVGMIHVI
jgi:hypothetical protein